MICLSSTDGDCTIIILPDPSSSGVVSILPESRSLIVGEPGESSSNYSGSAQVKLTRGEGMFSEVVVTWALTPRDLSAFQQVEGSITFLNLQQTASIILQVAKTTLSHLMLSYIVLILVLPS